MRIVSLDPSATEILFAVGMGSAIVGRTHRCVHPPEVASIPVVTTPGTPGADGGWRADGCPLPRPADLDVDLVARLAPDLVLASGPCDTCGGGVAFDASTLPAPLVGLAHPHRLEDALHTITRVAASVGAHDAGFRLRRRIDRRIDRVLQAVADRPRPRVVVLEWPDPACVPGSWVPDMVTAAGGIPALGEAGAPATRVALVEMASARPDVILLGFRGLNLFETQARMRKLANQPGWLPASRPARIIAIDGAAFLHSPGPRLAEGIGLIAWALHRAHPDGIAQQGRVAELIEAGWVDLAAVYPGIDVRARATGGHHHGPAAS